MRERFNFQSLIYLKAGLHQVFTDKLEINTVLTLKATHYLAILMTLSASRSLLSYEFMMSLVPICKTAISVIASALFKIGQK